MSGRAVVAWVASPLALAALGLVAGVGALVAMHAAVSALLAPEYEAQPWMLALALSGAGTLGGTLASPVTRRLRQLEGRAAPRAWEHLRQCALVYALVAYAVPTWGGGDGPILHVFVATALAGVAAGNAAAHWPGWPSRPAV